MVTRGLIVLFVLFVCVLWSKVEGNEIKEGGQVTAYTTHGIMIDAGSDGSRLHVFSWEPRRFRHFPTPLTVPENDQEYTERIRPGISNFLVRKFGEEVSPAVKHSHNTKTNFTDVVDIPLLKDHFSYLISFAKKHLHQYRNVWSSFPIFVRATGGVRVLSPSNRTVLMDNIRSLLHNKSFCPFHFQHDSVRVLSGEEEAVFAWAAVNYLHDLLPDAAKGTQELENNEHEIKTPLKNTFGTIDLGATSSQIAFYVPSQDISSGLFKLQLGTFQSWNLYAKSFLQFGYDTARLRHLRNLGQEAVDVLDTYTKAVVPRALDYCLFAGYSEAVQVPLKKDGNDVVGEYVSVEIHGPAVPAGDQMERCMQSLRGLLHIEKNTFCDEVFFGECSIDGTYQPPLPQGEQGHFVATSTYKLPWQFLQMPPVGTVTQFRDAASVICSKSFNDIVLYDATLTYIKPPMHSTILPYYCLLSSYIVILLDDGYGFTDNNTISTQDDIRGNKVNWAYGAMLYEVNSLPIEMIEPDEVRLMGRLLLAWSCGVVAGVIIVGGILSQFLYRPHQRPSSDLMEQSHYKAEAPKTSSFYHDLAKIYNGGGSSNDKDKAHTNVDPGNISQYSPFANQSGRKETSTLLVRKSRRNVGSSVDSSDSADTVRVLKTEAVSNNNYQTV